MINAYQTQIPLVVEIKVGKNWADMIKYVK
jgi:hypothetical protein